MPKVVYSASKGLYQESGSGFEIGDVAVAEASESVASATATAVAAYGTSVLTVTGSETLALAVNTNVGATKFIIATAVSGGGTGCTLTVTNGGVRSNGSALSTLKFDAEGEFAQLISDGTQWICVSAATGVEA